MISASPRGGREAATHTFAKIDQLNLTEPIIKVDGKLGRLYNVLGQAGFERLAVVSHDLPNFWRAELFEKVLEGRCFKLRDAEENISKVDIYRESDTCRERIGNGLTSMGNARRVQVIDGQKQLPGDGARKRPFQSVSWVSL